MMSETRNKLAWDQVVSLLSSTNHDVYDKRLIATPPTPGFDQDPQCIFFYYVRIDGNGMVRADHYFYCERQTGGGCSPIPHADVPGILYNLALNARPSTTVKNPPKLPDNSFERIEWKHKSYMAIFFDEANWAFHRRNGGKPSVAFNTDGGATPNHSFFDAADVELDMPNRRTGGTDKRSAIYLVNHMKGEDGQDLGAVREVYKFDMFLEAKYAESQAPAMTVIFDPGGTNQGPPQPP
jgi:hypothetical protein